MPAFFNVNVFKNDAIAQGGSLTFGQSIIQNRNSVKQNLNAIAIGDGLNGIYNGLYLNGDQDGQDMSNFDANNFGAPQA